MFANKCEGVLLCELCACGCVDQVVGLSAEGECVSRVGFGCLVSVHLGGCVNQGEVPFCSGLPQWLSGRIHLQCRSPMASSVHGISQARTLEWVAISSSRRSSQSKD